MKERPILFSGPMVRAIREGRKTQTRRLVKPQPQLIGSMWRWSTLDRRTTYIFPNETGFPVHCAEGMHTRCPYGQPGDRLWVRETFKRTSTMDGERIVYRADHEERNFVESELVHYPNFDFRFHDDHAWRPSIHMPQWASRITLEILSVHAERLNDISNEDCWKEGMCDATNPEFKANRRWFSELWESINGPESWNLNPWVWVVESEEVKP